MNPRGATSWGTLNPRVTIRKLRTGWWEWEVYHSGYGLAYGCSRSKKKARRKAQRAWADLTWGEPTP